MFIIMNYILGESFSNKDFASLEIVETSLKIDHINYFIKAKSQFFHSDSVSNCYNVVFFVFIQVHKRKMSVFEFFNMSTYIKNFK